MLAVIPNDAYVLIIGAMKAGTTSLYRYLEQHPKVSGAVVKEPEFFLRNQGHAVKAERYSDLWPTFDPEHHDYALEASTGYSK